MPHQEKRLCHATVKSILKEACCRTRQRESALFDKDGLNALQDLTGLPGVELAAIAGEATEKADIFSSIRRQLLLAVGFLLVFPGFPLAWLLY